MRDNPTFVSLLCVGDELTEGRTRDSHVQYLGTFFRERNFRVREASLIPDDDTVFAGALERAVRESHVVIITGGLGPTADDLTRETIERVAGVPLVFRDELWADLVGRYKHRRISPTNRKQALVPEGFDVFPNPRGTAVGIVGEVRGCIVAALPGPPRELRGMVHESLEPYLAERFALPEEGTIQATCFAVGESDLEEALQKHSAGTALAWGTKAEELRVAFTIRGGSEQERWGLLGALQREFGPFKVRAGDVEPVGAAMQELERRGRMLVCAESCTGGLITKYVTDIPGSSAVLWGGFVTYADEAKIRVTGVAERTLRNHGAVSRETVEEMAHGALTAAGLDNGVAVSVSGIAGPEGGSAEKPVGTVWIAVALAGGRVVSRSFLLPGSRDTIRRKATASALLMVHGVLVGDQSVVSETAVT